jgi:hypothetical protein
MDNKEQEQSDMNHNDKEIGRLMKGKFESQVLCCVVLPCWQS